MCRLFIYWLAILPIIASHAPHVAFAQISLRSELVCGSTLPLQAIAVRYTLAHDPAGDWPERQPNAMPFEKLRKPGTSEFFDLCGALDSGRPAERDPTSHRWNIRLSEGEQVSFLICTGAEWRVSEPSLSFRPLFEQPGAYALATNNYAKNPIVFEPSHSVEVNIATPVEEDALIYQLLKKDRVTTALMLSTYHIPDELCMRKLEELITQHPDSSYADYARFALARGYFKSNLTGEVPPRADVEKSVMRYIESEQTTQPVGPRFRSVAIALGNTFVPLRGRRREIAEKISFALSLDQQVPPEIIREMVNLKWTSDDELQRGRELLEAISNQKFPFYGNALILLSRLYKLRVPDRVAEITALLNEKFSDHYDWLAEIREEGISPYDWRAFRVQNVKRRTNERR